MVGPYSTFLDSQFYHFQFHAFTFQMNLQVRLGRVLLPSKHCLLNVTWQIILSKQINSLT